MDNRKKIIIGLGSGRCGTMSLSILLTQQKDSNILHEGKMVNEYDETRDPIAWSGEENKTIEQINKLINNGYKITGDCGMYFLPYVDLIINYAKERFDVKFVCLKREKNDTIISFLKFVERRNHWIEHDGSKWTKDDRWDKCFPKFKTDNIETAIAQYWDLYYSIAEKLQEKYPENFKIFNLEELKDNCDKLAYFLNMPPLLGQKMPKSNETNRATKNTTFCIKAFNRPQSLTLCLRSILKNCPNSPIIVCDDSTKEISYSKSILDRITLIKTPPDIGASAGRNILVKNVNTDYLFMMDDDHELPNNFLFGFWTIPPMWLDDIVVFPVRSSEYHNYMAGYKFEKCLTETGYLVWVKKTTQPPYHCAATNFLIPTKLALKLKWDERCKMHPDHFMYFWNIHTKFPNVKINVMPDRYTFNHFTTPERFDPEYMSLRNREDNVKAILQSVNVRSLKWWTASDLREIKESNRWKN